MSEIDEKNDRIAQLENEVSRLKGLENIVLEYAAEAEAAKRREAVYHNELEESVKVCLTNEACLYKELDDIKVQVQNILIEKEEAESTIASLSAEIQQRGDNNKSTNFDLLRQQMNELRSERDALINVVSDSDFMIKSRSELVSQLWSAYQDIAKACKSSHGCEHSHNARGKTRWLLSNYLTEVEKLHLGIPLSVFPPDNEVLSSLNISPSRLVDRQLKSSGGYEFAKQHQRCSQQSETAAQGSDLLTRLRQVTSAW